MPPNCLQLKVEDTIIKFNKMHEELDVIPSSTSYEKLVKYSCDSNEVFFMLIVYLFCYFFSLVLSLMAIPSLP